MHHFAPDVILEEEIFVPCNIGPDCDTIGQLLFEYGEKFILSALEDGEYAIAVENYLRMLDSLARHFIAEEHWNLFDDFYSPDYTVSSIWDKFIPYIRSGALAGENLKELEAGLTGIEASEGTIIDGINRKYKVTCLHLRYGSEGNHRNKGFRKQRKS